MKAIALGGLALSMLGVSSCIIRGDKCDAHQAELDKGGYLLCVCESNAVPDARGYGCTPCGADEQPKNDACVCKDGYTKNEKSGTCELDAVEPADGGAGDEIGAACSATSDCSAAFPYCAKPASGERYCTLSGCSNNADCPEGWSCESAGNDRYCRKAPTGYGSSCSSSADCAGFEAAYCDTFQTHTCLVAGCATGDSVCPNEWGCCDYSSLLGSPLSICVQPAQLDDGACPMGGTLVSP